MVIAETLNRFGSARIQERFFRPYDSSAHSCFWNSFNRVYLERHDTGFQELTVIREIYLQIAILMDNITKQ